MTHPVFDGHNDVLTRLWRGGSDGLEDRWRSTDDGHLDLDKARAGRFAGGFFACYVPSPVGLSLSPFPDAPYDLPLPDQVDADHALRVVMEQAGILHRLHDADLLRICRSAAEIDAAETDGQVAAILHIEGAEALDPELRALDALWAMGVRSIGPVWSRPTVFGHGVPFRFPSDGDIGPGLTDAGKRLAAECLRRRIVFDTSHLNVKGFEDAGDAGLPLVATHSNAHAIAPSARNLTDAQLRMVRETGGVVGLNYATDFLSPTGSGRAAGALDHALRHLDHMVDVAGEDHVGLGSDFDGAPMPEGLEHAGRLQDFLTLVEAHGFGPDLTAKIAGGNWRAFLTRYWGG